jgi:hypothetical protein
MSARRTVWGDSKSGALPTAIDGGRNLQAIKQELRRRMHDQVAQVGGWLKSVLNGYYQCHAVPGNLTVPAAGRYWFRRSAASTGRCGGQRVTAVPTATVRLEGATVILKTVY